MSYCQHDTGHDLVKVTIHGGSLQLRKQCRACGELFGTAVTQRGMNMARVPEYKPRNTGGDQLDFFGSQP